ncbi:MAG: sensor histidine kinase [Rhizobiales bacterium]|nr:sensor histidine kinase [Hyphomicrobiales bacterium]
MTAGVEEHHAAEAAASETRTAERRAAGWFGRFRGVNVFSSLTRRIIILNLAALVLLVSGILYLNQFRKGLIDARVESLLTQGEIIASAIAASATSDPNSITIDPDKLLDLKPAQTFAPQSEEFDSYEFAINPEKVAPILRRLISPTKTRARIYDRDGTLIIDSLSLYSRGQILRYDMPAASEEPSLFDRVWRSINLWLQSAELPRYKELGGANGKGYPEVTQALGGSSTSIVRVNEKGELIVSVAVPIQRYRVIHGVLLLSTQGGDIDAIVHAERLAIVRVFVVASGVTILLSILLAFTIATPLRRLAYAAERVRHGVRSRPEIPDYTHRRDEIGHLSQALRDMTSALYTRIEAIESFAADVSHELKNPLTSLRSAVETLPLARTEEAKARLTGIIQHDIRRLNRLITDISDASRLDAELGRQDLLPVDLRQLLTTVVGIARETTPADGPKIVLDIARAEPGAYVVPGHDSRLGQVINNLLDNARSFSPPGGRVRVAAHPLEDGVEVTVEDEGPGIRADQFERIFERFYTDRPDGESFGQNSGLGLSITKQIVDAHRGRIFAENRIKPGKGPGDPPVILGARFTVQLPGA